MPDLTECINHYVYIDDGVLPRLTVAQIVRDTGSRDTRTGHILLTTRIIDYDNDEIPEQQDDLRGMNWTVWSNQLEYIGIFPPSQQKPRRYRKNREYLIANRSSNSPQAVLDNPPPPSKPASGTTSVYDYAPDYEEDDEYDDYESDSYDDVEPSF